MAIFPRKDNQWSRKMFLLQDSDFPEHDAWLRYATRADITYHDTSIGGHAAVNPLPQSTIYADPPVLGFMQAGTRSSGMGAIYSESFDQHQQLIHIRFGVPRFNSMMNFLSRSYSYRAAVAARQGRDVGMAYYAGSVAPYVVGGMISFVIPLALLGLQGLGAIKDYLGRLMGFQNSKYYYLKPAMSLYWANVTYIINHIATNMRFSARQEVQDENIKKLMNESADSAGRFKGFSPSQRNEYADHASGLFETAWFEEDGSINVVNIIAEAQRRAYMQEEYMKAIARHIGARQAGLMGYMQTLFQEGGGIHGGLSSPQKAITLFHLLDRWNKSTYGGPRNQTPTADTIQNTGTTESPVYALSEDSADSGQTLGEAGVKMPDSFVEADIDYYTLYDANGNRLLAQPGSDTVSYYNTNEAIQADERNLLNSELNDGIAFLTLRVDYTGAVSEQFSNNTTESAIRSSINSMSAAARDASFSIMGGNIADVPLVGPVIQGLVNTVKDSVGGVMDRLGLSGLAVLGGAAFADIPKHWQDSSYGGPRFSYTITLDPIYDHPMARLFRMYFPLACLLAGAMPKATGLATYTSPYLCEVYDRGRGLSRLAIMRNLSISRGNGNLGFLDEGKVTQMEVSFEFEELSSIMHMPMSGLLNLDWRGQVFSEDTLFSDYMATLCGLGLTDMIYPSNAIARQWSAYKRNLAGAMSVEYWSSKAVETAPGRFLSMFYRGVDRQ